MCSNSLGICQPRGYYCPSLGIVDQIIIDPIVVMAMMCVTLGCIFLARGIMLFPENNLDSVSPHKTAWRGKNQPIQKNGPGEPDYSDSSFLLKVSTSVISLISGMCSSDSPMTRLLQSTQRRS